KPVRLRVAVLRAHPDRKDPTPIIHLPGGPGDSAGLDAQGLAQWRAWQQRAGRPHDVVLFDPRGTGKSRPRWYCGKTLSAPYRRLSVAGANDGLRPNAQALRRCLQRLGPVVVAGLGPRAQLRDLDALIDAL